MSAPVEVRLRSVIVLAHPEPTSFNAQMADVATRTLSEAEGDSADIIDLHRMGFDPVERGDHYRRRADSGRFDAQTEQRHAADTDTLPRDVHAQLAAIEQADLLILQYPMWWYGPPAILKGWLDRVFVYGRTYTGRQRYDRGYFRGKRALLSVTTGGPEATFQYNGRNGDIEHLLWPMQFSLYYVGFTVLAPFVAFGVEGGLKYSAADEMARRLADYQRGYEAALRALDTRATVRFNGWDDWDAEGRLKPGVGGYSPFMRTER